MLGVDELEYSGAGGIGGDEESSGSRPLLPDMPHSSPATSSTTPAVHRRRRPSTRGGRRRQQVPAWDGFLSARLVNNVNAFLIDV